MTPEALNVTQLRKVCDPAGFAFQSTAELAPVSPVPGQSRAEQAIRFAVGIGQHGYNVFVAGASGMGKRTLARRLLAEAAQGGSHPDDWCYVNNFSDPQKPLALRLPCGRAIQLRKDMARWVDSLRSTIPAAFESAEYRAQFERIDADFNERQAQGLEKLGEEASQDGVGLVRTPAGFSVAPLQDHEVMPPEVYQALPEAERKAISGKISLYEGRLASLLRDMLQWRRERAEKIRALNQEVIEFAVAAATEELTRGYADLPAVLEYIGAARGDVLENADAFRKQPEGPPAMVMAASLQGETLDLRRYEVNVMVQGESDGGAPVEIEDNPSYVNLVGRVEHIARFGALSTDFNLIRPGALHRANGGYLVIDAAKLLSQPFAWEGLKRALTCGEIRIEGLGEALSVIGTRSLEPQPIPLSVKVLLYGSPWIYYLLESRDPEFPALFRVLAEFDDEMPWNPGNAEAMAQLLAAIAHRRALRPFSAEGVAAVVERAARISDDTEKLSLHIQSIEELAIEGDHFAREAGCALIGAPEIRAAVAAQQTRVERLKDRTYEAIARNIILIDTSGEAVARVNGLAVFSAGKLRFAQPTRISATVRLGKGEIIDIQREVQLGGAIHTKGVLTLSAFLALRFARLRPLSVTATLSFEQTYGEVDGDSASVAELCALLSALADVPIRQDLAVTGSVSQAGQVQAIGAVNEKIEGFFDICRARGLTGSQGVVIPQANRQHLMLRDDLLDAVREGRFHVYAADHVDQVIELLTGRPSGDGGRSGSEGPQTINALVAARLEQFEAHGRPREMRNGGTRRTRSAPRDVSP
jgi:predicted ATP-dependent protease